MSLANQLGLFVIQWLERVKPQRAKLLLNLHCNGLGRPLLISQHLQCTAQRINHVKPPIATLHTQWHCRFA